MPVIFSELQTYSALFNAVSLSPLRAWHTKYLIRSKSSSEKPYISAILILASRYFDFSFSPEKTAFLRVSNATRSYFVNHSPSAAAFMAFSMFGDVHIFCALWSSSFAIGITACVDFDSRYLSVAAANHADV